MKFQMLFRNACYAAAGLSALFVAGGIQAKPKTQTVMLIENVTAIDAKNGSRSHVDVRMSGGTITSVSPHASWKLKSGTKRIDGAGKFLIPGLWDAHVHLTYTKGVDHRTFFPLSLAHGVTSLRDTGGHLNLLKEAREIADSDALAPDLYVSGPLIDGSPRVYDGHNIVFADLAVAAATPEEGVKIVDGLAKQGVDFIKAYEMLSPETFAAIVARARFHNLPVATHSPLSMSVRATTKSGVADMQHLRNLELACVKDPDALLEKRSAMIKAFDAPNAGALRSSIHKAQRSLAAQQYDKAKCDNLIETLAKENVIQTPTIALSNFGSKGVFATERWAKTFEMLPPKVANLWRKQTALYAKRKPDQGRLAYLAWSKSLITQMNAKDIVFMAGTDAPIAFLTPGISLHEELAMLVDAGLSPMQALKAATITPAAYFGKENAIGTIAKGMKADLVLLNSNPLTNIRNSTDISAVLKDGRYLNRAKLDALLAAPTKIRLAADGQKDESK